MKSLPIGRMAAVILSCFLSGSASGAVFSTLSSFNNCLKTSSTTCTLASGTYDVNTGSDELVVTGSNLIIEGDGYSYPTIRRNSSTVKSLLKLSGTATAITIQRLRFDGNNTVFNATTHAGLKQFLLSSGTHDFRDVFLSAGYAVTLISNYFVNSSRYAVYVLGSGSGPTISNNWFTLGLDAAIRTYVPGGEFESTPFITGMNINNNNFYGYRGAGIVLDHVSNSQITNNGLTWCHSGDVWGGDVDQSLQGGGQIYLSAHSRGNQITGNGMDGRKWQGYQSPNNASNSLKLNNYGVELDRDHPVLNTNLFNNTATSHSVSGMWIGGSVNGIVLSGNNLSVNSVQGIILEGLTNQNGVKIKGGVIQNNGGGEWPNGSNWPKWYGVFLNQLVQYGVCIQTDVSITYNQSGSIYVQNSGNPAYQLVADCN